MNGSAAGVRAVQELCERFRTIAATRMAGLPICHPGLEVAVVDFLEHDGVAEGVLITPWCMNLVRLPLDAATRAQVVVPGMRVAREVGLGRFDFIGAEDALLGRYEAASLCSPMHDFTRQLEAVAAARVILARLRGGQSKEDEAEGLPMPGRRRWLLGGGGA